MEDLRWFCIREISKLQETARFSGRHIRNLKAEVDILKDRVGTKSEAHLVQDEFGRFCGDTLTELLNLKAEIDATGTEAKLAMINDLVGTLGAQVQEAFRHVAAV